ncbi:hypothetical protein GCM10009804_49620 [Kribbella hippodromi]|uniref:DUF3592 domain-containing protein n=1 Tax=Kribbella hippodromi TaxID=434347 RepID=A0ABP4PQJ5_9ACTN
MKRSRTKPRGDRRLLALVQFFAFLVAAFGGIGLYSWYTSRPLDQPTATVSGTVVSTHGPAWYSKGAGAANVQYAVGGTDYQIKTRQAPGDYFLRIGDVTPIEYVVAAPATARAVWAVDSARSDARVCFWIAGICAGLGLVSCGGWWLSSGRRGGLFGWGGRRFG